MSLYKNNIYPQLYMTFIINTVYQFSSSGPWSTDQKGHQVCG